MLRQAERFLRSLGTATARERPEPPPARRGPSTASAATASPSQPVPQPVPQPASAPSSALSSASSSPQPSRHTAAGQRPPGGASASSPVHEKASGPLPPAFERQHLPPVVTPAFDGHDPPAEDDWTGSLAAMVASLCLQSDPAFESWSIVVPLDPRVLPETELRLSLSRHRLSVRFHTQSAHSLQLVFAHRSSLLRLIEQAMPSNRDIDIDVT